MMQLRPYQTQAVESVYQYLRDHDDNPCVVIPTAGGKTPVLSTICRDAVNVWHGRVLILAHVKKSCLSKPLTNFRRSHLIWMSVSNPDYS